MHREELYRQALQQRRDYSGLPLHESDLPADPLELFRLWLSEAVASGIEEANAMCLATCSVDFKPSCRMVLLKDVEDGCFVFYTHYESRKGKELTWNPYASLLFFWQPLSRQVRIEGRVEKVEAEASDRYFASRPLGSQIAAIASPQSSIIESRQWLEQACEAVRRQGMPLKRPDYWGGYKVIPYEIEFWQGQPDRLHDRIRYIREGKLWLRQRLAP
ncbi:MAG: pyridoxamine 5'-phosphate oxidase [Chitinophagales bacterium]|nr:pyridoxamine 5'-phosphate oxidase [Chitinophagales bacterium]MDW8428822.1 pyridoxamine 5'-phosphate oxidase [Chitinophagales bacterium]